jgi:epothilone polyketide synthase E
VSETDARLLRLLKDARDKLQYERRLRSEPLAIVGMGCRFPGGVESPAAFWALLEAGVDATGVVPGDRWDADAIYDPEPATPGKSYVTRGGFLGAIDGFEPEFFGISPREAVGMDPQQRLLLEVAWEALEDAGIVPNDVRGTATGTWVGMSLDDYASRFAVSGDLARIDAYSALGNARSVAAGRIAYVLDLRGPVMQLDASCASSLVALHLACQSLRSGECDRALVGGVNLMSSPQATVALCQLRALAADGRCKTFDAAADGYARGEGCGVVVLERLSDARVSGRRIHAVIRGSALNHDGRSNGLTAPNGGAQEAVLKAALANANVAPASVGYVEAHGTGTLLGDPIEVLALSRVYGQDRPADSPLRIGSVKTNFGHLEGAAGMAGLIKAALCLRRGRIAPQLHLTRPNPRIPWAELAIRVANESTEWPRGDAPRVAGVSAFGISGTNAHVVLEEAPAIEDRVAPPARSAELVVLSARTPSALVSSAERLGEALAANPEWTLRDVAFGLLTRRAALERRWAFAVPTKTALVESLRLAASAGRDADAGEVSVRPPGRPKIVFVFPGQGSQWLGMGRTLSEEEPVFRKAMAACDRAIAAETGWSVSAELVADADRSRLDDVGVVQPVLFAMEVALAALWRSWGVEPDAVIGHSMGEVAAACVSGALSLEEGATVVCRRSAALRRVRGQGEMALVELTTREVEPALDGFEDRVGIAASNGPRATVLSGEPGALASVLDRLERAGVFCRRVKVDVASHGPQMDGLLAELVAELDGLRSQAPRVPMRSTVTGADVKGGELDASYWAANLRRPVRFGEVVESICGEGFTLFVEVSPHPLLVSAMKETLEVTAQAGAAVGSLRRDQPERLALLESLAALYLHGVGLVAERLFEGGGRPLDLPTYPWQRQRYWVEASKPPPVAATTTATEPRSERDVARDAVGAGQPLYRIEWVAARPAPAAGSPTSARWVVVSAGDKAGAASLCEGLRARGVPCELVDATELRGVVAEHVACAWPALGGAEEAVAAAQEALGVLHGLEGREEAPRLWWITQRCVAVSPLEDVAVAGSTVWGLGRTVMQERPDLRCVLLDLESFDGAAAAVLRESAADDEESQVAWRDGDRFVARLVRARPPSAVREGMGGPSRRGTVLVTGGLGALGLRVARSLAERGVPHLVLMGRRSKDATDLQRVVGELEGLGARVTLASADVANAEALAAVLASVPHEHPLRGVVHAAGLLDDGILAEQTAERFARVMAPKVIGAWNLHVLTRDADLDFFVLFSSAAAALGSAGQSNYAAANAFLDALAQHRRATHLPASSLAWGPWAEGGLAATADGKRLERLARRGFVALPMDEGAAWFEALLSPIESQLVVARIDLGSVTRAMRAAHVVPALWRALIGGQPGAPATDGRTLASRIAALPEAERLGASIEWVRSHVARMLLLTDARALPTDRPWKDLGLDSLMGLELRNAVGRGLGAPVSSNLVSRHRTIGELAEYLLARIMGVDASGGTSAAAAEPIRPPARAPDPAFPADARLDDRVRALEGRVSFEPDQVLLTGATGFLGAFLLHELLTRTKARVTCLVRAPNASAGAERVARNAAELGVWSDRFASRIEVVCGNLERPRLGLDQNVFEDLAARIDAVYNNGATLSFVESYEELKASHVEGTREVLALASLGRPKAVHHVSSVVVFDAAPHRGRTLDEDVRPTATEGIRLPYAQCKWVTEALVWSAGDRGIPVTVYRPSFIGGASAEGAWNTADFLCRMLKYAVDEGCLPGDLDVEIDMSPVDYVARSIVHLSRQPSSVGRAFHLQSPRPVHWSVFREMLRSLGHPVEPVPYWEWVSRVEANDTSPLHPLLPFLTRRWPPEGLTFPQLAQLDHRPRIACERTVHTLRAAGIECAPLDARLIGRYVDRMVEIGFLGRKHRRAGR